MNNHPSKIKRILPNNVIINQQTVRRSRKQGIQHTRHISSLEVKMCDYSFLREMHQSLQFKSLKKFKYSSFGTLNQELNLLAALTKRMRYRQLDSLDLYVANTEMAKDWHLRPLVKNIRQLSNLKTLAFQVYNFYVVRGMFLTPLKESLRRLNKIENYKIQTELCNMMTPEARELLSNSFTGLNPNKLTNVFIDLGRIRKDLSQFILSLCSGLENYHFLKSFYLNFSENIIQNEALTKALASLSQLKSLEEFGICNVDKSGQEVLFTGITRLQHLKSIHLKLEEANKQNIVTFAEGLSSLSSLREFKLSLTYSGYEPYGDEPEEPTEHEINDEVLDTLCKSLLRHSASLEVLDLTIAAVGMESKPAKHLTSKGVSSIVDLVTHCSQLRQLHLFCLNEMDEATLLRLSEAVGRMRYIRSLFLKIQGKEDATDATFTVLGETLASSSDLQELSLLLSNFPEVTDEGISKISKAIPQLNHLRVFNMHIEVFPKLTEMTKDRMLQAFRQVNSLESVYISFILEKRKSVFDRPKGLGNFKDNKITVSDQPNFGLILGKVGMLRF